MKIVMKRRETDGTIMVSEPAESPSSNVVLASIKVEEDVGGHRAITIDGLYVDSTSETSVGSYLGITTNAAEEDDYVKVQRFGILKDTSFSFTEDEPIFIGANGILSQTVPTAGYIRRIGWAVSATKINLDPMPPIQL